MKNKANTEKNLLCLICDKPFIENERKRMIPFEKPYGNLFAHHECFKSVNFDDFLSQNTEKVYNLLIENSKKEEIHGG